MKLECLKQYRWFQDMKALAVVKLPKGAWVRGTLTGWEYKEENGKLVKYRVRMTIRGDQQATGQSFVATDLYAPVLKAHEKRLLLTITKLKVAWSTRQIRVKLSCMEAWRMMWYM